MGLGSFPYSVFLVTVFLIATILKRQALSFLLLAASLLFYALGDFTKIPFLFGVILIAYLGGRSIDGKRSVFHLCIWLALVLSPLLYFKYHIAAIPGLQYVATSWGRNWHVPLTSAIPPIGISFFTLQAVGYLVDVYRRLVPAEQQLYRVALFLSFFPLLLAGPIERASHLMPQLGMRDGSWLERSDLTTGLFLILKGTFVKFVFADNFATFVDEVYSKLADQAPANAVMACYLYSAEIYCDFYGYTLIALGSAALFGIELINNFDHPYLSSNIIDFWRRWHISLTNWLRDYVFFSLGGLRKPANRYRNTFITMLVCGLWHGAGLKFLLWGALHGIALILNRLYQSMAQRFVSPIRSFMRIAGPPIGILLTFHFVTVCWIPFRADSFGIAKMMVQKIAQMFLSPSAPSQYFLLFYIRLACCFVLFEILDYFIDLAGLFRRSPALLKVIWIVIWFCALYFAPLRDVNFIYFRF